MEQGFKRVADTEVEECIPALMVVGVSSEFAVAEDVQPEYSVIAIVSIAFEAALVEAAASRPTLQ
jgi:hypothetical protein